MANKYTFGVEARARHAKQRQETRQVLLDAGLRLARDQGYSFITRSGVTDAAGRSAGSLNHVFGSMAAFRAAVLHHAVQTEDTKVVAQGLAAGDPIALAAPDALRARIARGMMA